MEIVRADVEARNLDFVLLYFAMLKLIRGNRGKFMIQNENLESKSFSVGAVLENGDRQKHWLQLSLGFDQQRVKEIAFRIAPLQSSYPRNLPDYENTFLMVCEVVDGFAPSGTNLGKVKIIGQNMFVDCNFAQAEMPVGGAMGLVSHGKVRKPSRKDYPDLMELDWKYYFTGYKVLGRERAKLIERFGVFDF